MKLYFNPASPFARKVCVLLNEAGMADQVEILDAVGHPLDDAKMPTAHNPLGKLPCLVRDGGATLYDSRVITRYLDDLAGGRFYPDPPALWETLTLEATADGMMDAAILMVYEGRCRPEEIRSADWVEGQWTKVARSLDVLEGRWMSHLHGPLDMGQIAVACALGYLDFRHPDRDWRAGRPGLSVWFKGFADLPSMQATHPEI